MSRLTRGGRSLPNRQVAVRYVAVDDLKLDPRNPNRHDRRQIKKIARSIEKFGFIVPVLADADANVIAGEGRIRAAKSLGQAEVPVTEVAHLTKAQLEAFRIADHQLCRVGAWDERLLAETFKQLSELKLDPAWRSPASASPRSI